MSWDTGGDGLNIRPSPSTSGDPVLTVPQGTSLTVIGGPAEGSGLSWWNVQTAGRHDRLGGRPIPRQAAA